MVTEPTWQYNTLVAQYNIVSNVMVGEHFGSCSHDFAHIDIRTQARMTEKKIVLRNFKKAKKQI